MPTQNNIITLEDTDIGSGVALWVQTSADWWMVSVDSSYAFIPESTTYTSNQQFLENNQFTSQGFFTSGTGYLNNFSGAWATFFSYTARYTSGAVFSARYTRTGPTSYSRSYSPPSYTYTRFYSQAFSGQSPAYTASYSTQAVFTSGTNYTTSPQAFTSSVVYTSAMQESSFSYSSIIKISRSINDIVSEVSSLIVSSVQTIKSIIVQTLGNQITAKAFSEITPVTQIGDDLTYTATGAIINTKYGISLSKSEYGNDTIGSSLKIERN
jgi:hypothetical protein